MERTIINSKPVLIENQDSEASQTLQRTIKRGEPMQTGNHDCKQARD